MSPLLSILLLPKHQMYIKSANNNIHQQNEVLQGSLHILKYVQQELFSPTYVDRPCSVVSLPAFHLHISLWNNQYDGESPPEQDLSPIRPSRAMWTPSLPYLSLALRLPSLTINPFLISSLPKHNHI